MRQRQEICGALKGSSFYYRVYVAKNSLLVLTSASFIIINYIIFYKSEDKTGLCEVDIENTGTKVFMQCRQKRYDVFIYLHCIFTLTLGAHFLINIASLVWALPVSGLRRISGLIVGLRKARKKYDTDTETGLGQINKNFTLRSQQSQVHSNHTIIDSKGEDFLFLFDLIAHSCGKSATLRVLSHTAPSFAELCQPIVTNIQKTEKTLKIMWEKAELHNIKDTELAVDEYVVAIFSTDKKYHDHKSVNSSENCEAKFTSLEGGKTQYMVTISAIVGQAKMKGITNGEYLPPYPPQKLNCSQENQKIKINWTKPKGDFDKYSLKISLLGSKSSAVPVMASMVGGTVALFDQPEQPQEPDKIWLPTDKTDFILESILPGEAYQVELSSMTDTNNCLEAPKESFISLPYSPTDVKVTTSDDKTTLSWQKPDGEGYSTLIGYKIVIKDRKDAIIHDHFQKNGLGNFYEIRDLIDATEYEAFLTTLCSFKVNFFKLINLSIYFHYHCISRV